MEFKATQMSIDDCLRLKRKYIIPRFQREYSWETEELSTIWEDLMENLLFNGKTLVAQEYFLGSLVLVGDEDDSVNMNRYIVDGQQRLMTFTIGFSALTQTFAKDGQNKLSNATFAYILAEDSDGNEYSKVVAENPKPFFQYRIQQKQLDYTRVPQNQEEKRILNAYTFFERHLEKTALMKDIGSKFPQSLENISYADALKAVRDQILICKVVYVTVKSFEDAYTIFEVLNAKGKDLTAIDIIKNSIFSILTNEEPIDFAAQKWKAISNNISKCNEDIMTFYRHFWLSKYGFTTTKKLVKDFQKIISKDIASYTNFINYLEKESIEYNRIVNPNENEWTQPENLAVFTSLEALSVFNTSQVRTFLLALFASKESNKISHKNYIKVLRFLEHFHFVFTAVCSSRASGLERRYSSYARRMRQCANKQETATCVIELINALKETLPPYEIFESKFMEIEYTSDKQRSKKLVQYILKKLDNHFAQSDEYRPQSFTIEHIVPESTKAPFVGLIGNLLPLGEKLNGELADRLFKFKIKRYPESRYAMVNDFVEHYSKNERFSEKDVNNRTRFLSKVVYEDIWLD
ncbi:DUF262 domain-containing protein [Desulfosporosinus sp. BG]|uniref:DUF262 domain-containing protein n=1 Tax=Desulfosporosinus sp. BG TaxID=1633135 RepID=UPI0008554206|nr:DUF262 domain-containing protein [Desulfosporosinus sp. BG]ODA42707.1 RloF protein [Desulfosporosinus sp. BG]